MTTVCFRASYFCAFVAALGLVALTAKQADAERKSSSPLQLEVKIPLGDVEGRIDHMAIDLSRQRLFVAELGHDGVMIVDLRSHNVIRAISGLKEPQGVGYVASTDTLFVTNARDGSVLLFRGSDYEPAGRLDLGDDADNIRVDAASNRVFVGYGNGALAIIDLATNGKIADISLQAHPESFQLARSARQIFVNVPKAREIAVIDRFVGNQTASWGVEEGTNFPMALACTSAVETDTWMCSSLKEIHTAGRRTSPRFRAREPHCLSPNSIDFSLPLAPIPANRRRCGSSDRHLERGTDGVVI
jgi:hypothetical protein